MEKIKLSFLGTGATIPTKNRNHISILLSYKNENILVDCGESTQRQFRKADLNPCSITKVLITHWHGDHILGLPGLLQTLALSGYQKTLHIYMPKGTKNFMELIMKTFIFEGKLNYKIEEVNGKFFENSDFYLEAFPLKHSTKCNGYSFIEKNKLRINKNKINKLKLPNSPILKNIARGKDIIYNNKKIKANSLTYLQNGRKISFVFDTGYTENIIKNIKNANLIVIEATYLEKEKDIANRYHHLTASQAAHLAKKAKAEKLILTHISPRYEAHEEQILKEAKKIFKFSTIPKDLEKIQL